MARGPLSDRGRNRRVARPRHAGAGPALSRSPPRDHMNDRGRHSTADVHGLDRLSRSELRALWSQELSEQPPATLGRDILALGIAYARQERSRIASNLLAHNSGATMKGAMKDVRGQRKSERQHSRDAVRQCSKCGRWFTVKKQGEQRCPRCRDLHAVSR
jgi:hypothetical protein